LYATLNYIYFPKQFRDGKQNHVPVLYFFLPRKPISFNFPGLILKLCHLKLTAQRSIHDHHLVQIKDSEFSHQEGKLESRPTVTRFELELNNLNSILARSAVTPVFPPSTLAHTMQLAHQTQNDQHLKTHNLTLSCSLLHFMHEKAYIQYRSLGPCVVWL